MADPELEAIRQARMAQLGAGGGGGVPGPEQQQQQADAARQEEEKRQEMLSMAMAPAARERLHRVALVKPEKARGVEQLVLTMASRGQLTEKVSEDRLIQLLESISNRETEVTITRKRPDIMAEDW